jgi:hypothetical protein
LVINKVDILEEIGNFTVIIGGFPRIFTSKGFFENFVKDIMMMKCSLIKEITFSYSQEKI